MCQYPRLIVHPSLRRLFSEGRFDRAVVEGTDIYCTTLPTSKIVQNASHDLSEFKGRTQSSVDKTSYVYNSTTGECHPLFLLAPCRRCNDCLKSRYTEIKTRAMFELASVPFQSVLFFTLTYDDEHLPNLSEGSFEDDNRPLGVGDVNKEDIADFRRRFAVAWSRDPRTRDFETPRFLIVSEYGPIINKFGYLGNRRPHYHGIAFLGNYHVRFHENSTATTFNTAYERHVVRDLIFNSWGRCDIHHFDCQIAKDTSACVKYVTKYVTKGLLENSVPRGRRENFVSMPRGRRGSLGAPALSNPSVVAGINMSTDCTVPVTMCYQINHGVRTVATVSRLRIPRFFIDKLFPSYSQVLPASIKRAASWLFDIYRKFDYHNIDLSEYVKLPQISEDYFSKVYGDDFRLSLGRDARHAESFVVSDFTDSLRSRFFQSLLRTPLEKNRPSAIRRYSRSISPKVIERISAFDDSDECYGSFLRMSYRLRETARTLVSWLRNKPTAELARKYQLARDRWLRPYRMRNENRPLPDPIQGYLHVRSVHELGLLDVSLNQ